MARTTVPDSLTARALIVPCTLITFPMSSALPGTNEATHLRVLTGYPPLCTPFLFRPSRNSARCLAVSSFANAVGGPPSSVCLSRLAAINSFRVVAYAAATRAAVKPPTGPAGGGTMPAAPSAQPSAGVPANGSDGGPPNRSTGVIVPIGDAPADAARPAEGAGGAGVGGPATSGEPL